MSQIATAEPRRKRTIHAALAGFGGTFFRAISSFVSVRLCLSILGKDSFAVWVFVQNASGYFALSEAGVGQATLNEQGKAYAQSDYARMSRVLVSAVGLYFALVSIAAVAACVVLFTLPVGSWIPSEISSGLLGEVIPLLSMAIVIVLCAVPLTSFGATLSGARHHHVRQSLDAILPLFTLSALAAALLSGGGLRAAVVVTPIAQVIWGLIYLLAVKRYIPEISLRPRHFSIATVRELFSHSMFFFLIGFCLLGFKALPPLLVGRHGTVDDVSNVYALILLVRGFGWAVMDSVSRVVQPYIILFEEKGERDKIAFFTRLGVAVTSFGALILVLIVLCFGDWILRQWLHGPAAPAMGLKEALCFSFLLDIALLPVFNTLIALNRHRTLGLLMAVQSVLMIGLAELFVQLGWFGGGAIAVSNGILVASLISFLLAGPLIAAPGMDLTFRAFVKSVLVRPLIFSAFAFVMVIYNTSATFFSIVASVFIVTWFVLLVEDERTFIRSLMKRS